MSRIIDILNSYDFSQRKSDYNSVRYIFHDEGRDYLEILVFLSDMKEVRFILDNFPMQRKIFSTNVPYRGYSDFESDLTRMGIKIPKWVGHKQYDEEE